MERPLEAWLARQAEQWLVGAEGDMITAIALQTWTELQAWSAAHPDRDRPCIWIVEPDPWRFLALFIAATSRPAWVLLGNPAWTATEWQPVAQQHPPDLILGQTPPISPPTHPPTHPPSHPPTAILIPTGGSSGSVRFALHTWKTLCAAVRGFQQHFAVERVNSCCVLPLYHVSGLMQCLRSLLTGGQVAILPWHDLLQQDCPAIATPCFLSLVPTQLQRLLHQPRRHPLLLPNADCTVLLGGAPAWDSLLQQARQAGIRLAPTYGMTETAAQIATLHPEDFAQGRSGCGRVLPHARVTIRSTTGDRLPPGQVGLVAIAAESLMLGYAADYGSNPEQTGDREWLTADLGWLDGDGYLHIVGRRDDAVLSGGETIFPAEIEAAIWRTGLVQDVCVVGVPDADWGQAIAAVYVPTQSSDLPTLQAAIAQHLSRYKLPKHWLAIAQLPRNPQGKLNRSQVQQWAQQHSAATKSP